MKTHRVASFSLTIFSLPISMRRVANPLHVVGQQNIPSLELTKTRVYSTFQFCTQRPAHRTVQPNIPFIDIFVKGKITPRKRTTRNIHILHIGTPLQTDDTLTHLLMNQYVRTLLTTHGTYYTEPHTKHRDRSRFFGSHWYLLYI